MPKKSELKCYFNCKIDGSLHTFPKENSERFNEWKKVLTLETQLKGNNYITNSVGLCYRHFENCYISQKSHKLTRNAIPTLNLVSTEQAINRRAKSVIEPSTSTETTVSTEPAIKRRADSIIEPSTSTETYCDSGHLPSTSHHRVLLLQV